MSIVLTLQQVKEVTGYSEAQIRRWIRRDVLRATRKEKPGGAFTYEIALDDLRQVPGIQIDESRLNTPTVAHTRRTDSERALVERVKQLEEEIAHLKSQQTRSDEQQRAPRVETVSTRAAYGNAPLGVLSVREAARIGADHGGSESSIRGYRWNEEDLRTRDLAVRFVVQMHKRGNIAHKLHQCEDESCICRELLNG